MAPSFGRVEDIFFVMEVLVLFDREEMNWRATCKHQNYLDLCHY